MSFVGAVLRKLDAAVRSVGAAVCWLVTVVRSLSAVLRMLGEVVRSPDAVLRSPCAPWRDAREGVSKPLRGYFEPQNTVFEVLMIGLNPQSLGFIHAEADDLPPTRAAGVAKDWSTAAGMQRELQMVTDGADEVELEVLALFGDAASQVSGLRLSRHVRRDQLRLALGARHAFLLAENEER
jgi:hypothetical protein